MHFVISEKYVSFSSSQAQRYSNKGCKFPKVDLMTIISTMIISILIVIILWVGVIHIGKYLKKRKNEEQENNYTNLLLVWQSDGIEP